MKFLVTSPRFQLIEQDLLKIAESGLIAIVVSMATYLEAGLKIQDFARFGAYQTIIYTLFTMGIVTLIKILKTGNYVVNVPDPNRLVIDPSTDPPIQPTVSTETLPG